MVGYYGDVLRHAKRQALKDAKLDNATAAIVSLGAQAAASFVLYISLGGFTEATGITRLLTALTPFLAFPVALLWNIIRSPAILAAEQDGMITRLIDTVSKLEHPPKPNRYDDGIYQGGKLVGIAAGFKYVAKGQVSFASIEESSDLNTEQACYYQEMLILITSVGRYIGTKSVMEVHAKGATSRVSHGVKEGVSAVIIGDRNTARIPTS
jgi:hypothetical protein